MDNSLSRCLIARPRRATRRVGYPTAGLARALLPRNTMVSQHADVLRWSTEPLRRFFESDDADNEALPYFDGPKGQIRVRAC